MNKSREQLLQMKANIQRSLEQVQNQVIRTGEAIDRKKDEELDLKMAIGALESQRNHYQTSADKWQGQLDLIELLLL